MELPVELRRPGPIEAACRLELRLLGPVSVLRNGAPLVLPASRKVRALLGFLALAPRPVGRSQLCELFWDVPNDPRGELRWCLSKVRRLLAAPGRQCVVAAGDTISLDLADCPVDALEVGAALRAGLVGLAPERLRELAALFTGDFLEGLELDRNPSFSAWLTGQRRRLRVAHAAVLERLSASLPGDTDEVLACLDKWIELAPFELRPHEMLLAALARRGRIREGEEHLAALARRFEAEAVDWAPLRESWRALRRSGGVPAGQAIVTIAAAEPQRIDVHVPDPADRRGRASIAVMPFAEPGVVAAGPRGGLADGLTTDVIARLARLRNLFVIARGSVFALDERGVGPAEASRVLDVDYYAAGSLRRDGDRVAVTVELVEARTTRIVWTEEFAENLDEAFLVLDGIGDRIVASLAGEIEACERNRALLKPPGSLGAWEAYHRGLWHMYRFCRTDNAEAQHFLKMAVRLDPSFARAHAALSFTHWQNAFQGWGERRPEVERALETARLGLLADERDPAAHWAMGRSLWLDGVEDRAVEELERAVELSPNFALGHYSLAFVGAQSGDPTAALAAANRSSSLSPFDPLLFAMHAIRAVALVRMGRFGEAAEYALKAAGRPNIHPHALAIAVHCLALAGRGDEARTFAAVIHRTAPHYRVDDFLATFRFPPDVAALFRKAAKEVGMG